MAYSKRGRNVSRLEAFSDCVFALSATLLVVSLEVPSTFAELTQDLKGFGAFGLSFGALILIWSVHNAFFRRYGIQDNMTILVNACLLFVVLFYVYPLKFVSEGIVMSILRLQHTSIEGIDELSGLFVLYGAGFIAVFICVTMLYLHAYRRRTELELSPVEQHEAKFYFRHYMIFVVVGILSVTFAGLHVGLSFGFPGMIYMLIGPLCYFHGVHGAKHKPVESGSYA